MAVLATPKSNSYIIKKSSLERIRSDAISEKNAARIKERANLFKMNNLQKPDKE